MRRPLDGTSIAAPGPWTRPTDRNDRSGVVLVVVLVVVVMVAFAGFGFVASMSTEYEAVKLDAGRIQSDQVLASAEALLEWYVDHPRLPGDPLLSADPAAMFRSVRLNTADGDDAARYGGSPQIGDVPVQTPPEGPSQTLENSWRFTVLSPVTDGGSQSHAAGLTESRISPDGVPLTRIQFGPASESGRLNLELLLEFDAAQPGSGRESLMRLAGLTPDAADSLLDWIDVDDVRREFGAEAVDYQRQSLPYRPRNGLPETIAELLFVRGITRSGLFGLDANRNFHVDDVESAERGKPDGLEQTAETRFSGNSDEPPSGWADLVTIYSVERNLDSEGFPRIDLNSADLKSLHQALAEIVSREMADFVVLMRQYGPVESSADDVPVSLASVDLSEPASFSINAISDLCGSTGAVNTRSEFIPAASPMDLATQEGRRLLKVFLTRTSVTDEPLIRGRLNINLAGQRVLQSVPGLSDSAVGRLISRRETLDPESRLTTVWLIEEDILTVETYRAVQPWLTTGGDAFRCQIIAFRPRGGPSKRVELVTGPTEKGPRRFFWRDLTGSGMGFPVSVYGPPATEQSEMSAAGFQQE